MRAVHTLAFAPVLMVLVGPFFLNRVTPFLLGMPFLLSWLTLSLVLTSIVMAIIYYSDQAADSTDKDDHTK
ncbi:DUF3311 domain-containing protein [Achromobacter veterisilvae]|uniref:DUF3311 domain-containing protein n=1 Tax=Achromobacter veterisilvae TaxID=2069367 RepID=A0A446C3D5_9BURK|nr:MULTISPECIES: DUF3311 domain-containing protein [Achromobacter]MCW0210577.1 DUF3311 domain-containing protein [Achromobacter sp.]SSW62291.1 hypothetical protein AVE30378_00035 [Achromobacter veterisilvae]